MKKVIYSFAAMLILALPLFAQGGGSIGSSNPVSAAMGNTYTAFSKGVYSIHRNPGNLTLMPENEFELVTLIPLPTVNLFAGTDFISIEDYNYFFGGIDNNGTTVGRYLTTSDKDRLRDLFKDGGVFKEDISITYLGMAYNAGKDIGTFAFTIDATQTSRLVIPSSFIDFAIEGNPIGKVYDFSQLSLNANWLRRYTLSYARDITEIDFLKDNLKSFSVGVSLKLVHGFAHASTRHMNSQIVTLADQNKIEATGNVLAYTAFSSGLGIKYDFDSTSTESSFSPFEAPAGSGIGFDIGFNAQLDDIWTFGLAITDIGSITWNKNAAEFVADGSMIIDDVTDQDKLDSLANLLTGEGKYISEFKSDMPTAFRLGAVAKIHKLVEDIPGELVVAFDYNQGFNDAPRNSTKPRFSLGTEWRPFDIWPIRTGFTFGGLFGFGWSFGTGIDAGLFEFAIAAERFNNFVNAKTGNKITLSFGTRWRF